MKNGIGSNENLLTNKFDKLTQDLEKISTDTFKFLYCRLTIYQLNENDKIQEMSYNIL